MAKAREGATARDGNQPAAGPGEPDGQIPYEQARDQLTEVVRRLENGGLTLQESLALWERGERLAEICAQWLEGARARLAAAKPDSPEPDRPEPAGPGPHSPAPGDNAAPF